MRTQKKRCLPLLRMQTFTLPGYRRRNSLILNMLQNAVFRNAKDGILACN